MSPESVTNLLIGILVGTVIGYGVFLLGLPSAAAGLTGGVIGALIARRERRRVDLPRA